MGSIFEKLWRLSPAAFVLKAIVVAIVADGLLLAFILLRRTYRKRYFAKRDAHVFEWRQKWEALISGQIPYTSWRKKPFDRRIIEAMALDAFEAAGPEQSARLLKFLRASGLIEKRIFEARRLTGWRRMRALVALGRTRAPEGIPALAEGLRDHDELRAAAARAMSHRKSGLAFDVLTELVRDPIWFVRLRAIVSLGKLSDPRTIPALLRGLMDVNRLVRLRAAEGIVELKAEMAPIFADVVATGDRYGLHAYLTALENADLRGKLEESIETSTKINAEDKNRLRKVLQTGTLPAEEPVITESAPDKATLLP